MWAVTLTGAPKPMAIRLIEAMEVSARGWYGGAIGGMGLNGNVNTGITIRTILFAKERAWIQVGAGIVADSDPDREYQETFSKAAAMLRAIEMTERGLQSSPGADDR